jgi:predicted metal-dependent hydrolase
MHPSPNNPGSGGAREAYWHKRARRTAMRINLAWWLESLAAPLVILSIIASVAILLIRNHGGGQAMTAVAIPATLIVAIACWISARRKFESATTALVRIEASLGLHNALSTAKAGAGQWPEPANTPAERTIGLRWQWRRLALPPALSILTLVAALWMPLGGGTAPLRSTPVQPQAWTQLDAELDALMESAVVEESYIEQTRERLEELRARDTDDWYSHNTMEATDSIAKAHRNESNALQDALERAQRALDQMSTANPDGRAEQFAEYQQALEDMQNAEMQPNQALRDQLRQLDPENLNQLTPEQLEELQQAIQQAGEALRDALGDAEEGGEGEPGDGMPGGNGGEPGDGEGDQPGQGGPGEGGGHDPNLLGPKPENENDGGEFTPLAARDLSRSGVGDLLEVQSGAHDIEDTPATPTAGGTTDATGRGGDRIWRDALDPSEQRTLRKFFE